MTEANPGSEEQAAAAGAALLQAQSAETKFRGLLEAAPDAIVIVGADGTIELVNRQAEVYFGYDRQELLGQPIEILVPERLREVHMHHREMYGATPHTRPMGEGLELHARRKDGSEFPVEISLSPMTSAEGTLIIGVVRDTTNRVQAEQMLRRTKEEAEQAREEAERANRAKSEFLSRMSHELRTPLNAVLGFAQLLEMDPLTPTQHANVRRILRGGRHLLDLINEVLDITRIETGGLQLSPEPVRMREAVREALDLIRPLAAERGVHLNLTDLDRCDHFVLADRQRLKQVLLNLLANAVKYNREHGEVSLRCTESAGQYLRLDVRDTGVGIAPEDIGRLFSPFERLGADARGIEGTGLGLALSRGLVQAMGGTISVASTPGEGSTFSVTLSFAESPLARAAQLGEALAGEQVPLGAGHTVLYIEDNLPNLELIEQILARGGGINLLAAMQGRLGVELARQHRPDLILLDLHLPDLPGIEVLRLIREEPATREIPVVVISADATPGQIERLTAAGAYAYLTKPLDVPRFLSLIGELLEPAGA